MTPAAAIRSDLARVAELVPEGGRVLDIGCGDGTLLSYLEEDRNIDGRGLELSMDGVRDAVGRGLSVIQGNADTDLAEYPGGVFDTVILSHTLQATRNPKHILSELLRIGKAGVVSIPNFGHITNRLHLLLKGRMPVSPVLPYAWWETPNIHLCTLRDFVALCEDLDMKIDRAILLDSRAREIRADPESWRANLFAQQGIFRLIRPG